MKRLWIADIHANYPALEEVLRDAGTVDETVFLGDAVGFGPHPDLCVERLAAIGAQAVMGNHDQIVLGKGREAVELSRPMDWDVWSFNQLGRDHLAYLGGLPDTMFLGSGDRKIKVTHHPATVPYLHPAMPDHILTACLPEDNGGEVYFGHSHRQIDRTVRGCRYVCIPPVGQPRNRDPRAGYALETDEALSFRYVPYDAEKTASDIMKIGLEKKFETRWIRFLLSGFDPEWSREYVPV